VRPPPGDLRESQAYLLLGLISLIWAGNFLAGKIALAAVGPITLSALRAVLASGLLLWYVRWSFQSWPPVAPGDVRMFVVLAVTGLVTNTTLWYYGLHRTLAVNAAIVGATGPLFVAILAATWLREPLSALNVAGILISFAGVVLTVTRGSLRAVLDLDLHPGDFIILAAQVIWAVYSVYARQVARRFPPTVITTGTYLVSAALLVPLALVERPWRALAALGPGAALAILYAAVLVTVSHVWFYWGIRVVPAPVAAMTVNVIPLQVIALSWLLLDEPVTWVHLVGALVVISGVLLASLRPGQLAAARAWLRPAGPDAAPAPRPLPAAGADPAGPPRVAAGPRAGRPGRPGPDP
jgi:drug/metabolite transporter (DMT)-like permease